MGGYRNGGAVVSGRHQPMNGADSPDALRPYRVQVVDEEGPAWFIRVHASDRSDARERARRKALDSGADSPGVIRIVEDPTEYADVQRKEAHL